MCTMFCWRCDDADGGTWHLVCLVKRGTSILSLSRRDLPLGRNMVIIMLVRSLFWVLLFCPWKCFLNGVGRYLLKISDIKVYTWTKVSINPLSFHSHSSSISPSGISGWPPLSFPMCLRWGRIDWRMGPAHTDVWDGEPVGDAYYENPPLWAVRVFSGYDTSGPCELFCFGLGGYCSLGSLPFELDTA